MLFELTALISSSLVGCCCCFSSRDEKLQHFTTRVVLGTECSWKIVVWRQAEERWGGVNRDTELERQKRERVAPRGKPLLQGGWKSPEGRQRDTFKRIFNGWSKPFDRDYGVKRLICFWDQSEQRSCVCTELRKTWSERRRSHWGNFEGVVVTRFDEKSWNAIS